MISLSMKILLKSRRIIYYGNQMRGVPLVGIENVYFYVVETYSNKICYIFFYNFLVHLYCFKLRVVFFVISINDFTI